MWGVVIEIVKALLSALLPAVWERLDRPDTAEGAKLDKDLRRRRDALRNQIRDFEGI